MNGKVDENNRALLPVDVGVNPRSEKFGLEAWVDTAFDGHFVFSSNLIKELDLETLVETEAILADGFTVILQTYVCYLEWFGKSIAAQVVANEGRFPLLGTALLDDRILAVDYRAKTLRLS